MRVGIDWMPNEPANSNCASVSTLPNTMPGCCSDAASKMGPNMRQGPHHEAQKSTSIVAFDPATSSKFSFVSSTVAIDHSSLRTYTHYDQYTQGGILPFTNRALPIPYPVWFTDAMVHLPTSSAAAVNDPARPDEDALHPANDGTPPPSGVGPLGRLGRWSASHRGSVF